MAIGQRGARGGQIAFVERRVGFLKLAVRLEKRGDELFQALEVIELRALCRRQGGNVDLLEQLQTLGAAADDLRDVGQRAVNEQIGRLAPNRGASVTQR